MSFAKNVHETNELINKIDRYISDHESRQLELLKDLAILSKNVSNRLVPLFSLAPNIFSFLYKLSSNTLFFCFTLQVYGFDKTIEKYSENIELFQSFFSTKNQLNSLGEQLVEEQKAKEAAAAAEELRRNQEIEKQKQLKQSTQITEVVDFVPQPILQQQQMIDIKMTETRQTISPEEPPRFIRPLCEATVQEGERCQFVCQLQSWQPTIQIEWFKDDTPISMIHPHYVVRNENDLCTLSIEETFTEDSALFTCRATHDHFGSAETSAKLRIQPKEQIEMLFPPKFVNSLTNCKTSSGSSLLWKCFVEGIQGSILYYVFLKMYNNIFYSLGNPLPTIQWYKNDVCIDVSPRYNISYNNGEATIRLDDLCVDDAGKYTSIAKNILGVDQCSATLTVTVAPQSIDSLVKKSG